MDTFIPLPRQFYSPSAQLVAPRLLGHLLIRNSPEGRSVGAIVETEAYLSNDPACHAARGKTERNRVMWGRPGSAYVYLIYGLHFCVNAVCRPEGVAEAVLIRAVEPIVGEALMQARRPVSRTKDLANGPAKLCAALDITRQQDGVDLCANDSPLVIGRNPQAKIYRKRRGPIIARPRIGISRATDLLLRFYLSGSEFVSRK